MAKKQKIDVPAPLYDTTSKYLRRQISRREFLAKAAAAGLSLPALSALVTACGASPTPETIEVEKVVTKEVEKIVTVEVEKEAALPTSSMLMAEKIAKEKYAGETINLSWESGLQSQDPLIFSGPEFEKRTGVKVNVIESGMQLELFTKQLTEHVSGTGSLDILSVQPPWVADYVFAGVLEPLDDFVEQYMNPDDLDDYPPIWKGMGVFEGKRYGLYDDGDVALLYYRTDLFEEYGDEFADKLGYPLAPPNNWKEFDEIARFFTEKLPNPTKLTFSPEARESFMESRIALTAAPACFLVIPVLATLSIKSCFVIINLPSFIKAHYT